MGAVLCFFWDELGPDDRRPTRQSGSLGSIHGQGFNGHGYVAEYTPSYVYQLGGAHVVVASVSLLSVVWVGLGQGRLIASRSSIAFSGLSLV
jgi:hypothetical protein